MSSSGESVRHTVLLKCGKKEDKEKVAASLRAMGQKGLPGVTLLTFTVVTDLGLNDGNADVAVIAEFPDKENYLKYASHPDHLSTIAENKPYMVGRMGIQYTLPKM